MPRDAFVEHCLELLGALGPARARRMFGGHGIYVDDLFIALIALDRLYLKTDEGTRAAFAAAGCEPFVYTGQDKPVTMSYWTVPPEAMESPAEMLPWARRAMQAALAARASRRSTARQAPGRQAQAKPATPGPAPRQAQDTAPAPYAPRKSRPPRKRSSA